MARMRVPIAPKMKKDKAGKFAVDPNSKASKRRAERERRLRGVDGAIAPPVYVPDFSGETQAKKPIATEPATEPSTEPVETVGADGESVDSSPSTAPPPPPTAAPVDEFFTSPAGHDGAHPRVPDDIDDGDDDDGPRFNPQSPPKKKSKREAKLFATMATTGMADLWAFYVSARHPWIATIPNDVPGAGDLKEMATLGQGEQEMIATALGNVIAESDIEMTPGMELAAVLALAFLPRMMTLEGVLLAQKRQAKRAE